MRMLLWLLVFPALGLGAWGDSTWDETQATRMSDGLQDLRSNSSWLTETDALGLDDVFTIVSRKEWGAAAVGCSAQLTLPVDFLVTHHIPGLECHSQTTCSQRLQELQAHHVHNNSWCDVAYNFLVGDDGGVYEGVGWHVRGMHTQGYSNVSLGFAFFGTEEGHSPSPAALSAMEGLISSAVQKGHLSPTYVQPLLVKGENCLAPLQKASPKKACPSIVPRAAWGARETHCPKLNLPAKYAIIIHTAGRTCNRSAECHLLVQDIQSFLMEKLNSCDVGYNFLVGQDGAVYEGVGWTVQGSHTRGYNDIALGIAFLGTFSGPRSTPSLPVSWDHVQMLPWLLVFSTLGLGAWGDSPRLSQNETQASGLSEGPQDLFAGTSQLIHKGHNDAPPIVSRKEWGARSLTCRARLTPPVAYIIVDQLTGMECQEQKVCSQTLRSLQSYSVYAKGWCDVAYNFLVGDDGRVYEGVGWNVQGMHTQGYNSASLGLAFFGNKIGSSPSATALWAAENLISYAIQEGHLSPRYIQPLLLKEEICLVPQQPLMPRKACPDIIPRSAWEARETHCTKMNLPAKYVVIIHTADPTCNVSMDCQIRVRDIQSFHMDTRNFCDIGYNFLVGEDGGVYEGVGWEIQGAHTYGYNDIALGIAFIGNFVGAPPNAAALEAAQTLIQCAMAKGYLSPNYLLVGHSDISKTLSPGKALYNIIKTWPHFKH
ncbi:peptidoglycan recognition protein 4 isoform X2 [Manis pentadactyla]|uniref:peptidoglycan recognition protein 4 isoform X2 n=1 Tax=Manis pentadactyla TaxID=143292 RepID=UPI00255CF54D|nr:peptidoglycan recognition protein 4 isoform X2 [Manis pentadactyla]